MKFLRVKGKIRISPYIRISGYRCVNLQVYPPCKVFQIHYFPGDNMSHAKNDFIDTVTYIVQWISS
jgi:hypothetical protein